MLDKIYHHLPYLLLLLANLVYLYIHGFGPLKTHPKLFLYNFFIFLFVGIVVFFKASYLLHKWFILGQGDTKQKTKAKLKELLQLWETVWNYLRPGNQINLIYLYAVLASWTFIQYFIPRFLMGIFLAFVYEIGNIVNSKYSAEIEHFKTRFWAEIEQIKQKLPKYQGEE